MTVDVEATVLPGITISPDDITEHLVGQGLNDRTISQYRGQMLRAGKWFEFTAGTTVDDATATDVARWCQEVIANTRASRVLARRALEIYWGLVGREDPPLAAIRVPPAPRYFCRALSIEHSQQLSQAAIEWEDGPEGLAVLLGLYPPVLRRFEIAAMRWDGLDAEGWLTLTGKFDVKATIPVHEIVLDRIKWWRDEFEPSLDPYDASCRPGDVYVFRGHGRDHVSPGTVWRWVKRVAERAGIGNLTTHELRHTGLANLNDQFENLRATQTIARHAKTSTTAVYTRTTRETMERMVKGFTYGHQVKEEE